MQIVEKAQMVCGLWNSAAAPWIDWLYKEPGLFQPFRVLVLLLSFAPLLLSEHSRLYIWGGGGVWISLANCYHVSVVQLFVYYVIYVLRLVLWSVALNWTQGKNILSCMSLKQSPLKMLFFVCMCSIKEYWEISNVWFGKLHTHCLLFLCAI